MTRHFAPPSICSSIVLPADLIVEAARCWRDARDMGRPVQPCLFGLLSRHDCGMLAPVLDSVMTLCEAALGRGLCAGAPDERSKDEELLLGLIDGSRSLRSGAGAGAGVARSFACALCSARIMMGRERAFQPPAPDIPAQGAA
ncbi:MAG: hypothetical protein ABW192_01350 [Sphingobium sp.]